MKLMHSLSVILDFVKGIMDLNEAQFLHDMSFSFGPVHNKPVKSVSQPLLWIRGRRM